MRMLLPRRALVSRRLWRRSLAVSAVQGPVHPPLDNRTLSDYFVQEVLQKHNTRPALICRSEKPRAHGGPPSKNLGVSSHLAWDFEEFERHIDAAARGLLLMGVRTGDRIGVIMGNNRCVGCLHFLPANDLTWFPVHTQSFSGLLPASVLS